LQQVNTHFKLIKTIKDERFDEDQLHQYALTIAIGIRDFQTVVVDTDDNRLIFFEDYILGELANPQDLLVQLQSLFDAHPLLKAGFWKEVKIGIKNQKFIQVPSALFLPAAAGDYLPLNSAFDPHTEVALFNEHSNGAVTVFALYKNIQDWLFQLYPNHHLKFIHQASGLIEGVTQYGLNRANRPLYVYIDRFKLHIISVENGQLIYYNQFIIKQFSEYIKYIMLVLNTLQMDQQTSEIILWGYIGQTSPHYNEFVKYIRNVSFGHRPADLHFGYLFDEIQDHHFFDLFSIALL
jgi:hypothetical protein